MQALLPRHVASVDLVEAYAPPLDRPSDRPFVRANMITSLDGAVAVAGRSGALSGAGDHRLFRVLRSWADVVLVGAGTVRAEGYGPVRLADELRADRRARGQSEVPPMAVVTQSAALDWTSAFFVEAAARPTVFTTSRSATPSAAAGVADVIVAGDDRVDPRRMLQHLHSVGHRSVLLEGGPNLNADIARAGLLDELCLTLSPRLVAGDGPRVLAGAELTHPLELDVVHLLEEDGFLFYRLAVTRRPDTG